MALIHGFTHRKPCKTHNSMSILNRVPFLDGDKHIRGGRPCTCLPEEKARRPCLRHTFGSYLRGSPRDSLGIRGSGGPLFAESSGTAFLPCLFLTLGLMCWEDLGHPVHSLTDYFPTLWGWRCDIGVVWELNVVPARLVLGSLVQLVGSSTLSELFNYSAGSVPDVCSREISTN